MKGTVNQMDVFALLNHMLFHEMTHVKGIDTVDVGAFPKAYFWKNVQVENMDAGYNNAGTYLALCLPRTIRYQHQRTLSLYKPSRSSSSLLSFLPRRSKHILVTK